MVLSRHHREGRWVCSLCTQVSASTCRRLLPCAEVRGGMYILSRFPCGILRRCQMQRQPGCTQLVRLFGGFDQSNTVASPGHLDQIRDEIRDQIRDQIGSEPGSHFSIIPVKPGNPSCSERFVFWKDLCCRMLFGPIHRSEGFVVRTDTFWWPCPQDDSILQGEWLTGSFHAPIQFTSRLLLMQFGEVR